ncbi:hypothetical protein Q7P37_000590 [Cladosporium fusiforme]
MTSSFTSWESSSCNWTKQEQNEEFSRSKEDFFRKNGATSPGLFASDTSKTLDFNLEEAQAGLKEREAKLDEREAALRKQHADLAEREDALDAAHEKLIGGGEDEEDVAESKEEKKAESSSALYIIIEKLQEENEKLRAELAASKKRSGRFLSQRATEDDASGNDRFRLSERKSKTTPGGGLPMGPGFDPSLMKRWEAGHKMMAPRKPRPGKEEKVEGK